MPIYILEGPPRAGKSYSAVAEHIIPALRSGRAVVTDIPLNVAALNKITQRDCEELVFVLREAELGRRPFSRVEDLWPEWKRELPGGGLERPLIVVDEAHEVWPASGTKTGGMTVEMAQWFAMHGHHGFDIVVITQDHMLLAMDIRRRVEMRWKFKRLAALGSKMGYAELIYEGQSKDPLMKRMRRYRPSIFPAYKSFTGGGAPSQKTVRPVWLQPKFVLLMGSLVVLVLYLVSVGGPSLLIGAPAGDQPTKVVAGQGHAEVGGQLQQAAAAAPGVDVPPEVVEMRRQMLVIDTARELQQARLELDLVQRSVCAHATVLRGREAPAMFDGGKKEEVAAGVGCRLVPRPPPPPAHLLAGARAKLGGSVSVDGGAAVMWISVDRGGQRFQVRADSLRAVGWRFHYRGPCDVYVQGPWTGVLSCDWLEIPA